MPSGLADITTTLPTTAASQNAAQNILSNPPALQGSSTPALIAGIVVVAALAAYFLKSKRS